MLVLGMLDDIAFGTILRKNPKKAALPFSHIRGYFD